MTNPVKRISLINVDILNQNVLMVKASDVVFAIHYKTWFIDIIPEAMSAFLAKELSLCESNCLQMSQEEAFFSICINICLFEIRGILRRNY